MKIDLHNHTFLCNHASGSPLEYATRAYELGCKYYGFSDHAPMDFDEKYRMSFAQIPKYFAMIEAVKDEFAGRMRVMTGFEVDFMERAGLMDERVLGAKCDFLIGSVHFLGGWGFDNEEFIAEYKGKDIDALYEQYFGAVADMARSGRFDIAGHLDLVKVFGFRPKKDVRIYAQPALKAVKEAGMVLELNAAGYRKPVGELYPSDDLLELVAEMLGANMDKAIAKAREFGFTRAAVFQNHEREMVDF